MSTQDPHAAAPLGAAVQRPQGEPVGAAQTNQHPGFSERFSVRARLGIKWLGQEDGLWGIPRQVEVEAIARVAGEEASVEKALEELPLWAAISHPHVVRIESVGLWDGVTYVVREHIAGLSLGTLAAQVMEKGQELPADWVAGIGVQICAGLQAIHALADELGTPLALCHGSLSGDCLLLSVAGHLKINPPLASQLAERAQGAGEPRSKQADLHAVGRVLYDLLRGATGETGALAEPLPSIRTLRPNVPEHLAAVLMRVLSTEEAARPTSAAELGGALFACAMQTGRFVAPHQVAEWLQPHLPTALQGTGHTLSPQSLGLSTVLETTQAQPSPFSTTQLASPPGAGWPASTGSMKASGLLPPQVLGELQTQVQALAPSTSELALQLRALSPSVQEAADQVRRLRFIYWPMLALFWLMGLGLIMIGIYLIMHLQTH